MAKMEMTVNVNVANGGQASELVEMDNSRGIPVTTSRKVAMVFEKRHADVLRDIEALDCTADFRERNFAFSTYRAPGQRRKFPMYFLTKDGFTFLAMGYTGKKAAKFKEAYIAAFNKMEAQIKEGVAVANVSRKQLALMIIEAEEAKEKAEAELAVAQPKVETFHRIMDHGSNMALVDAGKVLGVKPYKMISALENSEILCQRRRHAVTGNLLGKSKPKARQEYIDAGYFVSVVKDTGAGQGFPQTLVTPKGLHWLRKKIDAGLMKEATDWSRKGRKQVASPA